MNNKAIIARLENVRPHPNADRLMLADVLGEQIITSKENVEGQVGVFFPAGLQIVNQEFALHNNLYRKHPETGEKLGGYLEGNGRIEFTRLRGEMSRGLWMPLQSLRYSESLPELEESDSALRVGTEFSEIFGVQICDKYMPPEAKQAQQNNVQKNLKERSKKFVNFYEVGETPRFTYNLHALENYKDVVITAKLHGTSGRTGYCEVRTTPNWLDKVLGYLGFERKKKYDYVSGTRRMVLNENSPSKEKFRKELHAKFAPMLQPGQIVYYEIVGWDGDKTIMPPHKNGKDMVYYSYGTQRGQYEAYVYKIIGHDVSGNPYVFGWDELTRWCDQHEVKYVPLVDRLIYDHDELDRDALVRYVHKLADGASVFEDQKVREGVCITIDGKTYKHKGDTFCLLENINPYFDPEDLS